MDRQRLFISLDLPQAIKKAAVALRDQLREMQADASRNAGWDISWARPEGMHLTLKFLGEVEAGRTQGIRTVLTEASLAFRPITITVEGLGGFPTLHAPRVIWLGIKDASGELSKLQKRVDEVMAPLGFPPEVRDFHPHLTLGRVKSPKWRAVLVQAMESLGPVRLGEWRLEELDLMESSLQPNGAVYAKLWTIKAAV